MGDRNKQMVFQTIHDYGITKISMCLVWFFRTVKSFGTGLLISVI